jgi:hypothetical protein
MKPIDAKTKQRMYVMTLAEVYPLYIAKVERKGHTKDEVDEVIRWFTGYSQKDLEKQIENQTSFENLFRDSSKLNPNRTLITGVICGIRVEEIGDPIIQSIRYLDKLIDELANGKKMEKILRKE